MFKRNKSLSKIRLTKIIMSKILVLYRRFSKGFLNTVQVHCNSLYDFDIVTVINTLTSKSNWIF